MGEDYKQRLINEYGLNPEVTSRDWEDSEHEILAIMIDDVKDCVENVSERAEENAERIDDHDEWIAEREGALDQQVKAEESTYQWGRLTVEILMAVVAILSVLVASGAI